MRTVRLAELSSLESSTLWLPWKRSYFQCEEARPGEPVHWVGVDRSDCGGKARCDLYNLDVVAYESLLVGQFAVLTPDRISGMCKSTSIFLGFSRDGFHWTRPPAPRQPLAHPALGLEYMQPIAGNFLVHGDRMHVYLGGAKCKKNADAHIDGGAYNTRTIDEVTALAVMRRDGFASVGAPASTVATPDSTVVELLTRAVIFRARSYLFVNVEALAADGELRVAILDEKLQEFPLFSLEKCAALTGVNNTRIIVRWQGHQSLEKLRGRVVHFRFLLTRARLFAFWVSPTRAGHSAGHFGSGGGPSIHRSVDLTSRARDQRTTRNTLLKSKVTRIRVPSRGASAL